MTTLAISLGTTALLLVLGAAIIARARRLDDRRAGRRAAALARITHAIDAATTDLDRELQGRFPPPVPPPRRTPEPLVTDPSTGLPGRVALVDALTGAVTSARADRGRVSLALLTIDGDGIELEPALAGIARDLRIAVPKGQVFRSGEHQLALVLEAGRAETIAAIARLEATLDREPGLGSAVAELTASEDAVSLLARAVDELPTSRRQAS